MNSSLNKTNPKVVQYNDRQSDNHVTIENSSVTAMRSQAYWPQRLATVISAIALIVFMASCESELTGPDSETLIEEPIHQAWNGGEAQQRPVSETVPFIFDEDLEPGEDGIHGTTFPLSPDDEPITDADKEPGFPETLKSGGWQISFRCSGLLSNCSINYLPYSPYPKPSKSFELLEGLADFI